jgi:hypothetical protein
LEHLTLSTLLSAGAFLRTWPWSTNLEVDDVPCVRALRSNVRYMCPPIDQEEVSKGIANTGGRKENGRGQLFS